MPLRSISLLLLAVALGCRGEAPAAREAALIAEGETLFETHCHSCHELDRTSIGPPLAPVVAQRPADTLVAYVRDPEARPTTGQAATMPAFDFLSEEAVRSILAYAAAAPEAASLAGCSPGAEVVSGQNPIPDSIAHSGYWLDLEPWLTLPASHDAPPRARLNMIKPDGTGRLFLNDLRGALYVLGDDAAHRYLDLGAHRPQLFHEQGLGTGFGAFAFHPAFASNGRFYTTHAEPAGAGVPDFAYADSLPVALQWVLTEWTARDPAAGRFDGDSRELLRLDVPHSIHGVQDVAFRTTARPGDEDYGLLYLAIGDGGTTIRGFPFLAHARTSVLGTLLRLDPQGRDSRNGQYGIPPSNPFVQDDGAYPELWAWGLRNPHRLTWDPAVPDRFFVPDIGEANVEELNLGVAGADYGWNLREGTFAIDPCAPRAELQPATGGPFTDPVAQYDHSEGLAISGGYVIRNDALPELEGKYIFGDIPTGQVFYVQADSLQQGRQAPIYRMGVARQGEPTTFRTLVGGNRVDLHVGLDLAGRLLFITKHDGVVWRVRRVLRLGAEA